VADDDAACPTCGGYIDAHPADPRPSLPLIGRWQAVERLGHSPEDGPALFLVQGEARSELALLKHYPSGTEPDTRIYSVLAQLETGSTARLLDHGRCEDRAFEVWEGVDGPTLADLRGEFRSNPILLHEAACRLIRTLANFESAGLRHGGLTPSVVRVRSCDPLSVVVADLSPARLAEFDIDVAPPCRFSRYMAPEAVVETLSAGSDWWSLGVILLELLTEATDLANVHERAFRLHLVARGVSVPKNLEPSWRELLQGLLTRDHSKRWRADQAMRWAEGERGIPVHLDTAGDASPSGPAFQFNGERYTSLAAFALTAAQEANWPATAALLENGSIANWLAEIEPKSRRLTQLRKIAADISLTADQRVALALAALNEDLPLCERGAIISPSWLLPNLEKASAWLGSVPQRYLRDLKREKDRWLVGLADRSGRVTSRARDMGLALNAERFAVLRLSTSIAALEAEWRSRREIFPDAAAPALAALFQRRVLTDEDLLLVLSAEIEAFKSREELLQEAQALAIAAAVPEFGREAAIALLRLARAELADRLEGRLPGFSRCGRPVVDEWIDRYRENNKRISLPRALVVLAVPEQDWAEPPERDYIRNVLGFLERKVLSGVQQGPLVRLRTSKTSARIDLMDMGEPKVRQDVLQALVTRREAGCPLSGGARPKQAVVDRLRKLDAQARTYRRDTGVNALMLGYPILTLKEEGAASAKIAPVLLWPLKITIQAGANGPVTLAFDPEREVQLNPAFDTIFGPGIYVRWQSAAENLLRSGVIDANEALSAFEELASLAGGEALGAIPTAKAAVKPGQSQLHAAGVLFLADFASQAIANDLRQLQQKPLEATALECLLRLKEVPFPASPARPLEAERFSTLEADPSQERAVLSARSAPGVVLQGPPGTGKSQTIVNVVADCLGRGETVLVVCEKQAALEVVHKRLTAEGLDHRVFRIENTVSDRAKVLRALQAQVPGVHQNGAHQGTASRGKRLETAAQIDRTEAELDAYHNAIYAPHARLGYSYRDLLSRISTESVRAGGLTAPALRAVLGPLDPGRLEAAIGECTGLLDIWIDGAVEGSPLAVFRPFPADAGLAERIATDLRRWRARETERAQAIAADRGIPGSPAEPLTIADPKPAAAWLDANAGALASTGAETLARVAIWEPFFAADSEHRAIGEEQLTALGALVQRMSRLQPIGPVATFASHARKLDDASLEVAAQRARHFRREASLLGRISPLRLRARLAGRALMRRLGLPEGDESCAAFAEAARLERGTRQAASELQNLCLAFAVPDRGGADLPALMRNAKALAADLDRFRTFAGRLDGCPLPADAWRSALAARAEVAEGQLPKALETFLERLARAQRVAEARIAAHAAFDAVKMHLEAGIAEDCAANIAADRPQSLAFAEIDASWPRFLAYQTFRMRAKILTAEAAAVFPRLGGLAEALRGRDMRSRREAVMALMRCEAAHCWKQEIEAELPQLLQVRQQLDECVARLVSLDATMREANHKVLAHVAAEQLAEVQAWTSVWPLTGANSKRLRQVAEKAGDLGLFKLRPVWLVNPDVVSRMFPLEAGLFDVVIFDEASQMRVANAVPALFRARRCIVSGDDKQLPPTAFFGSRLESDEADGDDDDWVDTDTGDAEAEDAERRRRQTGENRRHIKDCEDLLALSRGLLPEVSLDIHYRSAYRELIAFSNAAYYGGRLNVPVRRPAAEVAKFKPIEVRRIDGIYRAKTNPDEALAVVDYLGRLWLEKDTSPTIGVVTFNMNQADLIREEIARRADGDRAFAKAFERESNRRDRDEDVGFFVKNLENVQGDERDWVLFSTTFGRDETGVFKRYFGALGQGGGERRLNVAVTRAKQKVVLFTSMPTGDISTLLGERREPNLARDYLQAYLRYCELVNDGDFREAAAILNVFPRWEQPSGRASTREADALVEDALGLLRRNGFDANMMPADDAFAVDIAVSHPTTGFYVFGVEFDTPRHKLLSSARAREVWRPRLLTQSGMRLHRVVSAAWVQDPNAERQRLIEAARSAMEDRI
jgi:hypothetical protein